MTRKIRAALSSLCLLLAIATPALSLEEDHSATTSDGWRIALHRWRPDAPRYQEPILLAHGFIENRRIWDLGVGRSLARHLSNQGFDVWSMELRGSGDSQTPDSNTGWTFTIEDFSRFDAPAAVTAVLKRTQATKIILIGHSLGGLLAYSLMEGALAPKIKAAVTLAGAGTMSGGTALEQGLRRFAGLLGLTMGPAFPPGAPFPIATLMHKTLGDNDRAWAQLSRRLCSPLGQPFWEESNMTPQLVEALLRRGVTDTSLQVVKRFLDYARQGAVDGVTDRLSSIKTPVLALAGEKDLVIPPSDVRHVANLCRARYAEVKGAGHEDICIGLNAPTAVYPLIAGWLAQHATPLKGPARDWSPTQRQVDSLRPPAWR